MDEYFVMQTRQILTTVLEALTQDATKTFVWAETVYFSMWWDTLSNAARANVTRIIASGQLEIVAGGWVMPDEANTHYYALLDQLIEGHQWLEHNLAIRPSSGYSIDPFGHRYIY